MIKRPFIHNGSYRQLINVINRLEKLEMRQQKEESQSRDQKNVYTHLIRGTLWRLYAVQRLRLVKKSFI